MPFSNGLAKLNKGGVPSNSIWLIAILLFYWFLLVIEYTGIPINVIIIPPKAINVAVSNWFIITNKPPIIAIAGIIGYKGTL